MKLQELIDRLEHILKDHGDVKVRILTETEKHGQVEQNAGGVAYSERQKIVIIVPEGF